MSGKPITRCDAYRMVTRIAKTASRHISTHSLRHAATTNALDAGVPLRDAQILARHADPRTTEHYDRARGTWTDTGTSHRVRRWRVSGRGCTCVVSATVGQVDERIRADDDTLPTQQQPARSQDRAVTDRIHPGQVLGIPHK